MPHVALGVAGDRQGVARLVPKPEGVGLPRLSESWSADLAHSLSGRVR